MAKKKITQRYDEIKNVSKEQESLTNSINNAIKDYFADKVKTLREQGYDDNRIAAMLMIAKSKVQSIK